MNKTPALIAAFLITSIIGVAMAGVALSVMIDRRAGSPAPAAIQTAPAAGIVSAATDDAQQLQARISEYQAREQQYQTLLDDANRQLQSLNAELQQEQQLVSALQQMGIIQIDANGQVTVNTPAAGVSMRQYEDD
jgi:hypothetical protein